MAPEYKELALAFAEEDNVIIGKVDATKEEALGSRYCGDIICYDYSVSNVHFDIIKVYTLFLSEWKCSQFWYLCNNLTYSAYNIVICAIFCCEWRFDVEGYPTIIFFPAGSADPVLYEEGRDVTSMLNYVNKEAGTQRNIDGTLFDGYIKDFDAMIAAAGYKVTDELIESLRKAAENVSASMKEHANRYVSTAEKIRDKGDGYVTKEKTRLKNMIASPNVKPEQRSNFQYRINALDCFDASNKK